MSGKCNWKLIQFKSSGKLDKNVDVLGILRDGLGYTITFPHGKGYQKGWIPDDLHQHLSI
jgi:hypothetical protein